MIKDTLMKNPAALGMAFCLASMQASAVIRMEVIPTAPKQNEPVHVRITSEAGDALFADNFIYAQSGPYAGINNVINIIPAGTGQFLDTSPIDHTFYIGRLPQGEYSIRLGQPDLAAQASIAFTVHSSSQSRLIGGQPEAVSPLDHSGIWYKPSESGSSIVLVQSPTSRDIGGGIYGYRADKTPVWYTIAPGQWMDRNLMIYRAPVYKSQGSPISGPYNSNDFVGTQVGFVTLTFGGIDTLLVESAFDGVLGVAQYKRFGF